MFSAHYNWYLIKIANISLLYGCSRWWTIQLDLYYLRWSSINATAAAIATTSTKANNSPLCNHPLTCTQHCQPSPFLAEISGNNIQNVHLNVCSFQLLLISHDKPERKKPAQPPESHWKWKKRAQTYTQKWNETNHRFQIIQLQAQTLTINSNTRALHTVQSTHMKWVGNVTSYWRVLCAYVNILWWIGFHSDRNLYLCVCYVFVLQMIFCFSHYFSLLSNNKESRKSVQI